MFKDTIKDFLCLSYEDLLLVKDYRGILKNMRLLDAIQNKGFTIIEYEDVEEFRYIFENQIKTKDLEKVLVLVSGEIYIPYDIWSYFPVYVLDFDRLFPKLNSFMLANKKALDLDHIAVSHSRIFEDYSSEVSTKKFLEKIIYEEEHLKGYLKEIEDRIQELLGQTRNYSDWFKIAYLNARRNLIFAGLALDKTDMPVVSENFRKYIFENYGKLTGKSTYKGPIIVSKVMDFLLSKKGKNALIVIDAMSISDWLVLEKYIDYKIDMDLIYAMIPTITAISRQSLLAGILPVQLVKPFSLSNEKKQFVCKAKEYLQEDAINYYRGYDFHLDDKDYFITIIINDIDDLVHSQIHGMEGHIANIERMGNDGRLNNLIGRLLKAGFEVCITSDHGNKEAIGIGRPKGMGVEVETKSQKMFVLKDYASKNSLVEEYSLMEYPGYYLPKDYSYLICQDKDAFTLKGEKVMSHGGISIEEVIVPFIKIKEKY